jgi:predicted transcriptional regulator
MRERFTIDLAEGQRKALKQLALDQGRSVGHLMREAVNDLLDKEKSRNDKKAQRKSQRA